MVLNLNIIDIMDILGVKEDEEFLIGKSIFRYRIHKRHLETSENCCDWKQAADDRLLQALLKEEKVNIVEKIKPCPCCGNRAFVASRGIGNIYISCSVCDLETSPQETLKQAIAIWNKRVAMNEK